MCPPGRTACAARPFLVTSVTVSTRTADPHGMVALGEPATVARLLCLLAIVAGVVGLKLLH